MTKYLDSITDNMMEYLEITIKPNGTIIDIKDLFQRLSLDSIGFCAFGIEMNSFEDPNNSLMKNCKQSFTDLQIKNFTQSFTMNLLNYFPFLLYFVDTYGKQNYDKLRNLTQNIVENRTEFRNDFIDRLKDLNKNRKINGLTEDNIMAQGIGFFMAGFETTSNTMSTLCYNLAQNPQIQEKLFEEINKIETFDHETIINLVYLDAIIKENLRMYPPAVSLHRECKRDTKIGNILIKQGVNVKFPVWALHHSSEFYENPDKFRPERFLNETKENIEPYAYIPFGGGPRKCLGMRFALIEMKIALAKIFQKYQICTTPETKLDFHSGDSLFLSYPELKLRLKPRQ